MSRFILSAFGDEIDGDLQKQMEVLTANGIFNIELRGINGKNIVDYSVDEFKIVAEQMKARNFGASALGSPIGKIGINEDFDSHLDKFKNLLDLAKIIGTKNIRMFSFFMPKDEDKAKYRDAVMERWFKMVEAAKGYELMLLHENESAIYGNSPECCLDLVKTMNCPYVKLIFDPANFINEGYDTLEAFKMLKEYIVYMHIKDMVKETKKIVVSGAGNGNIENILRQLWFSGYNGFLSIEPHLGKDEVTQSGKESFEKAANALKEIIKKATV